MGREDPDNHSEIELRSKVRFFLYTPWSPIKNVWKLHSLIYSCQLHVPAALHLGKEPQCQPSRRLGKPQRRCRRIA